NGGLVQDVLAPLDGALGDRLVGEVAFHQFDSGVGRRQVLPLAGDEVVRDANRFAAAQQFFDQVRADEAGAARDQIPWHRSIVSEAPSQRTVSRILFPAFARVRRACARLRRVFDEATIIPLGPALLTGSSSLPG